MSLIYEVQSKDIKQLDDLELTKLLKMLLHLEATRFGISQQSVEVALNIRVADGGEDGRIHWNGGPANTDYLPSRFVQFQNKATTMAPSDCADEVVDSRGNVKTMVDNALQNGAAYVLFTTQELNQEQKEKRIDAIRTKFRELGTRYVDTAQIYIYDASTIQGWANRYVSAITAVLNWIGQPLLPGLQTWFSWEGYRENHLFEYVADEARRMAIDSLRAQLNRPRKVARVIGLSGLGKTRLALEVCRGNSEYDRLQEQTVYVNAAYFSQNLPGMVTTWVHSGLRGLLVVDNCDIHLHNHLRHEVEHVDSRLSLLTLHYNPEKDSSTDPMILSAMEDQSIKSMLEPVYGDRVPDLDRVVAFAQGFPQMAALLAEARLEQANDMGNLTDDFLISKLLWGGGDKDPTVELILQGCALFDMFGLEGEAAVESQFIAKNVIRTSEEELFRCVKKYEERGIVNRAGRYYQIIPKPLAIRLAADWWKYTIRNRQEELLATEMPGQLEDSFCEQIAKLDFLPTVRTLTAELCGEQGPFGQAEVILSPRGSRLFRALVEVNPSATSDALYRVISPLSSDELANISGRIRRDLVCALEKLSFHKDYFPKSAKLLLLLASEENEPWSNNATGQFVQLFRTFLSGTAAPPAERLRLIDEAWQSEHEPIRRLAVEALDSAISTYGASRIVGAEYQGSGRPLEEWRPQIWQEAFDYWISALDRLGRIAASENPENKKAKECIAHNIRGLMQRGRDLMRALDRTIKMIVDVDGPFWPEAIDSIKQSLSYDAEDLPEEAVFQLQEWLRLLSPEKLEDKLRLFVISPPFQHEKGDDGRYIDSAAARAKQLGRELKDKYEVLLEYLPMLLIGEQRKTFVFGKAIVESSGKWEPLLSEGIRYISDSENPNASFILGILDGIYSIDSAQWEANIELFTEKVLARFYPTVVTTGEVSSQHLERILELFENGFLESQAVSVLAYGGALDKLKPDSVSSFAVRLSDDSYQAAWRALDILAMYCHGSTEKWEKCQDGFKEILLRLPIDKRTEKHQLDMHHWREEAQRALSTGDAVFAVKLMKNIVVSADFDYGDLRHAIKPVVRQLLEAYGKETWPVLRDMISTGDSLQHFRVAQMLRSDEPFQRYGRSVLSSLSDDLLKEWCEKEPDVAPRFVARTTEVFTEVDGEHHLSNRAKYLIDEFGDSEDVLSALSSNMSSFGWSGSVVPYHEQEIAALETLLGHQKQSVRSWADRRIQYLRKRIEIEKIRDAEADWGIR